MAFDYLPKKDAAYDILHTGMSHPDIFRALLIRQGTFDERYVDVSERQLDRWQPIATAIGAVFGPRYTRRVDRRVSGGRTTAKFIPITVGIMF